MNEMNRVALSKVQFVNRIPSSGHHYHLVFEQQTWNAGSGSLSNGRSAVGNQREKSAGAENMSHWQAATWHLRCDVNFVFKVLETTKKEYLIAGKGSLVPTKILAEKWIFVLTWLA